MTAIEASEMPVAPLAPIMLEPVPNRTSLRPKVLRHKGRIGRPAFGDDAVYVLLADVASWIAIPGRVAQQPRH